MENKHTEEQQYKTVTQTSPTTILCDNVVFYTRKGFMDHLGLSVNSIGTPYSHIKSGKAEQFNFFSTSFFRPL